MHECPHCKSICYCDIKWKVEPILQELANAEGAVYRGEWVAAKGYILEAQALILAAEGEDEHGDTK